MITIPKQLQDDKFRFLLVRSKDKIPLEPGWQKYTNYKHDDPKLLAHLKKGGNYGVLCGVGELIVIDCDEKEVENIVLKELPDTFMVRTGGGGLHAYYHCDNTDKIVMYNSKDLHLGEIQGSKSQVIGPNCIHNSGNTYEPINEIGINTIAYSDLILKLGKFIKELKETKHLARYDSHIKGVSITEVIDVTGFKQKGDELYGSNPWHSSTGGTNFWVNLEKNVGYCFRCQQGISMTKAIALNEKLIPDCKGFLTPKLKKQVRVIAAKKYGIDLSSDTGWMLDAYQKNVEEFYSHHPFFYDKGCIFWFWNIGRKCYEMTDEIALMTLIDRKLEFLGQTVQSSHKNNYLEAFKRVGRENIPKDIPKHWVQFKDVIIDVLESKELEATPEYFVTSPIPWDIGDSDETPVMDKIFTEWVGEEYVPLLYEIMAYCTLPDYPLNRIFCFLGAGMNGKSCYLELVRRVIGLENTTTIELEYLLSNRFAITKLHKKLACFIGETDFNEMKKTSILKQLCGGDLISFEHKNKTPFDDYNHAKLMIATNNLPTTSDKTVGFYRRWVIVDFPQQFSEKNDILKTIPEHEYNNLACKLVKCLYKILKTREFTMEGTVEERTQRFEDRSNPLLKFLDECTTIDWDCYIFRYDFKKRLDDWCKDNNVRKLSSTEINKVLLKEHKDVRRPAEWQTSDGNTPILRAWEGLKWK